MTIPSHAKQRRRVSHFVDLEAEQSDSDSHIDDYSDLSGGDSSGSDFIDDDSDHEGYSNHPGFSQRPSNFQDAPRPRRQKRKVAEYHNDDSDSSSDCDSSRGGSLEPDGEYGSGDTLPNLMEAIAISRPSWRFRCSDGREREVADNLQSTCPMSNVLFTTYRWMRGWVYVSNQSRSPDLCKWISSKRGVLKGRPSSRYPSSLLYGRLFSESVEHDPAHPQPAFGVPSPVNTVHDLVEKWVRVKGGRYKGEICFVYDIGKSKSCTTGRAKVLMVPRIPLSMDIQMDIPYALSSSPSPSPRASPAPSTDSSSSASAGSSSSGSRKRKRCIPGDRYAHVAPWCLFNLNQVRSIYGQDSVKQHKAGSVYRFRNERYQHGLLIRQFRVEQLQVIDTTTAIANDYATIPWNLARLFVQSGHFEIPKQLDKFPLIREWVFTEGERVRTLSNNSVGIVQKPLTFGMVEVDFGNHPCASGTGFLVGQHNICWWDLVKDFAEGDFVEVVGGVKQGANGWIVACGTSNTSDSWHGERGPNIVEIIEKTVRGPIISPTSDSSGIRPFSVHRNMLRRIPVPYTQIPSSRSPSGTNTASPWIGVHVRVVNPNHTEKGQHGIVRHVFHGQSDCHWKYSSLIKGLQVKLLVEISNASSDNVLPNMPSKEVELDYYSVVDAETGKQLHEVHQLRLGNSFSRVSAPWKGVIVTIIQNHPDKGKCATVRDVIPVFTHTGITNKTRFPSGLKITVDLSIFTGGRRLELDYYGLATQDKSTGTLKWLHEVYKLNSDQSSLFQPKPVPEARRLNPNIPAEGIPLSDFRLTESVSAHLPPTVLSSAAGNASAQFPLPVFSSVAAPTSSSAAVSSSSVPPSTRAPLAAPSLPASRIIQTPPAPSSSIPAEHSSSSLSDSISTVSSNWESLSHSATSPLASPPLSSSSSSSSSCGSASSSDVSSDLPSPSRESSPASEGSGVSLGSSEHDISDRWICNPNLLGKKLTAIAHGGGYLNKQVTVYSTLNEDGQVDVIWERYQKKHIISPRWIWPRYPNFARDNGLLIVTSGMHAGKFARRFDHRRDGSMHVEIVDHEEGREDVLTGQEVLIKSDELCLAYESHETRELNHSTLKAKRDRFKKSRR
ncbi:hypothetical protein VKT23_013442 [Stygiomarasmius scandens]|uniref:Uncharacterized protein n=1 Tax=Marasmiellus scandens TaxID=2682957 RepID=A0ABR1J624_9AGAR